MGWMTQRIVCAMSFANLAQLSVVVLDYLLLPHGDTTVKGSQTLCFSAR